jgi:hypothetical protein
VAWLVFMRRVPAGGGGEMLTLGSAVAITFLPVYHRYYDLTVVVLLLGWMVWAWDGPWRVQARVMAVLMVPLLTPVGWQTNLVRKGWVPHWMGGTGWWDVAVMPIFSWVLLMMCVVTVWAMAKRNLKDRGYIAA